MDYTLTQLCLALDPWPWSSNHPFPPPAGNTEAPNFTLTLYFICVSYTRCQTHAIIENGKH